MGISTLQRDFDISDLINNDLFDLSDPCGIVDLIDPGNNSSSVLGLKSSLSFLSSVACSSSKGSGVKLRTLVGQVWSLS